MKMQLEDVQTLLSTNLESDDLGLPNFFEMQKGEHVSCVISLSEDLLEDPRLSSSHCPTNLLFHIMTSPSASAQSQ